MALLLTPTTMAGDTGYVEEVVVDKAARGQHISTALMHSLQPRHPGWASTVTRRRGVWSG